MKPSLFDGDGRVKINPCHAPPGTQPRAVTRAQGRALIAMFDGPGSSHHSAAGNVAWVLVTHCMEQGYAFTVQEHTYDGNRVGFSVVRADARPRRNCRIEIKWSPPDPLPRLPGSPVDSGAYVYRIYRNEEDSRLHICGTTHTQDPAVALKIAFSHAMRAGYTHCIVGGELHFQELQ